MSTGLDSQLGVATEENYGDFVVPTDFMEFDSESLARASNYLTSTGLRAGRIMAPIRRHKETTRGAGGTISMKVPNKGFGEILNLLHGESVEPVQQGATPAHLQTHNIGSSRPNGKSLTIQVGKPQTGGTVQPHTYVGSKITQAVFSCATGAELVCELTIDARDEELNRALAVASYPSEVGSYDFVEGEVTIEGVTPSLFSDFSLTIPLPMATERFGLQRSALKAEPLLNDYVRPTLSMTAEYTDDTLYDHFRNGDEVEVVADFEGEVISGAHHEQITFTAAACKIVGATPPVDGPGLLSISTPVEIYDDGTNEPVVIAYKSVDGSIDS